ncbi:hypothetical protein JHL22_07530 [Advenella sp. WQ 585]|uniref:Lipoprotein n=1 Tax=Advenella mandrilli TaxID=2800330 RepID=A0ABS1EEY9_9BURK|nr:hypothetical protein [Advenella mandrilli]MBK1781065.1 hypothetical protein [Advenella mandrilli]MDY0271721.1 hypothetical protein [Advenella sp.]
MKLVKVLGLTVLSVALTGCGIFGSNASSSANNAQASTVEPVVASNATMVKKNGNGDIEIYVGSITKNAPKKGKNNKTITLDDVVIKSGDQTYYTSGVLLNRADVKTVFVAKAKDKPALGLRLTPTGATKLKSAINDKSNVNKTVLASMDKSVFSTMTTTEAELQDGVLLIPMLTLNNARDTADMIRVKNK